MAPWRWRGQSAIASRRHPDSVRPAASPLVALPSLLVTASLLVAGCGAPSAPAVQVSYARTPVVDAALATPSSVPPRRITRLPIRPTAAAVDRAAAIPPAAGTPPPPADRPSPPASVVAVAPAPAAPAPPAAAAAVAIVVNVGQPTEAAPRPGALAQVAAAPAITVVAGASAPPAVAASAPAPLDVAGAAEPSLTPTPASVTSAPPADVLATTAPTMPEVPAAPLDPTVAPSPPDVTFASPTAPVATPSPAAIVGAVPADQGVFVTSNSKTARYYYARDDSGWHRIHADHQVWFLTADDLLRAFPSRVLHAAPTRRPTRTPTP